MMHLKYPRKRGFLYWDELGCIARSLGFHENIFVNNLPDEVLAGRNGITVQELHEMFDFHKYFNKALDKTSNIHTDEWNIHTVKKAVSLLDKHVFTFEEIKDIRLAYTVYESSDTRGMPVDEKIVQRAIKMCSRMISPQKMLHRIKHMSQRFEEPDHIQLHEFLDLLLWCHMYEGLIVKAEDLNVKKDERELFELEDFDELLTHYDQRLACDLDLQYKKDELRFVKEKFGSKRMPRDVPPVDQEIRKKQVRYHKARCAGLQLEITDSTKRVNNSRAGYVRDRPVSAPDLTMYQHVDPSAGVSALEGHCTTVMDMFGFLIRPGTAPEGQHGDTACLPPRPKVTRYRRPLTYPMVLRSDLATTNSNMDSLQYDIETIDTKYQHILEEDMDFLLPGYREKLANRPQPAPTPPPRRPRPESRPTHETLRRLSTPIRSGRPPPAHARACDARFRGWHNVKTSKGPHYVLTASSFDTSPNGRMLQKLQDSAQQELKRHPIIYRYTRPQAVPSDVRPHTSPASFGKSSINQFLRGELARRGSNASRKKSGEARRANVEDCSQLDVPVTCDAGEEVAEKTPEEVGAEDWGDEEEEDGSDASSVISWGDLGVYQHSGRQEEKSEETKEWATNETCVKVHDFSALLGKSRVLEDIKEAEEEESQVQPLIVPGNQATAGVHGFHDYNQGTANGSSQLASTKFNLDLGWIKHNNTAKQSTPKAPTSKIHDVKNTKPTEDTSTYIDPWFLGSSKLSGYKWVSEIMSTDHSQRQGDKPQAHNLCRLSRRGQGAISPRLKQRFARGISAV